MLRADMVVDSVEDLTHTWDPLFTAKTEKEKVSTKTFSLSEPSIANLCCNCLKF